MQSGTISKADFGCGDCCKTNFAYTHTLMTIYATLTPLSLKHAMGPERSTHLPAVGHRMSMLRSVKSFETGDNSA